MDRPVIGAAARLGFGISGPLASPLVTPIATEKLIVRAFALGVRFFDASPSYGGGEAERRLGEALKSMDRAECIVSTKVGIIPSGFLKRGRDFSPEGVRRTVEGSLQRLGVDRIDWLFLHGPAPHEITDELLATLEALKAEGRIAKLGVAGRGPEIEAALATGKFQLVMAPVRSNLSTEEVSRLAALKAGGVELIGIEALAPALPAYPAPLSPGALWRLLRSLATGPEARPAPEMSPAAALAWALGPGGADRVLTTTTSLERLEANVRAAESAAATLD